jgi:tripartite-type tricarboxylate transporter receptor subunit TctC
MRALKLCGSAIAAVVFLLHLPNEVHAQKAYPTKPIRLLVGFAPGGGSDIAARIVATKLESVGWRVVIDNRPGAGQIIATELTAGAPPDGYTLFMSSGGFTITPALHQKLRFDPIRDFVPIIMVVRAPNVLVIHPSIKARSVKELIGVARAKPGQLAYGSGGVGTPSHLSGVLFGALGGIEFIHVPYKGSGQAMTGLVAGETQVSFPGLLAAVPHINSGKLVALGVTTANRSALLPDLPTIAESGLAGYDASSWYGVIGPARIPNDIVTTVNKTISTALKDPDVNTAFSRQGADIVAGSPKEFASTISAELVKWKKVVAVAGIKPE